MSNEASKTFFRQSGWMVFCSVFSGVFFFLVHPVAGKNVPTEEYGVFGFLLAVLNCMSIVAGGLQTVFAQQTAVAVTDAERRTLASTARGVLLGVFGFWLVSAVLVFSFQRTICTEWSISNPAAVWLMLAAGLVSLWTPVFIGVLQGNQNFLWVGWSQVFNSAGRLIAIAIIVLCFGGMAAGMSGGLLLGATLCFLVGAVISRPFWTQPGGPVNWRAWLRRVIPLTLGLGAFQFMFGADPLFVQKWFAKEQPTGFYIAAGTLGRALCAFTGPVVAVMFPKIVRSAAFAEKSNALTLTVITTAVMAGIGALGLTLIAPWLLTTWFQEKYGAAAPLLPWFACAMVPLAMANVLLNNLLARNRYAVVPWVVLIALGYAYGLTLNHGSFVAVIQTMCVANFVFLTVVGFFSWLDSRVHSAQPVSPTISA